MKTFAIFLLSKETFMIRTRSILESYFRKRLSKENFLLCHYLNALIELRLYVPLDAN